MSFDVTVKNVLGRDITTSAEYEWDFDGDGFYDETTETPRVTHTYDRPGTFTFRVKATNKGLSNTKTAQITVRNVLKPDFEIVTIGGEIALFNTTQGVYTDASWSAGDWESEENFSVVHDFGDTLPQTVTLTVTDGESTRELTKIISPNRRNTLLVERYPGSLIVFSVPDLRQGAITIERPDQPLYIYLGKSKGNIARYEIDTDVTLDSNLNGTPDDDADNSNTASLTDGSPYVIRNISDTDPSRTMRIALYDEDGNLIDDEEIEIILAYNAPSLAESELESKTQISSAIAERDRVALAELKDLIRSGSKEHRLYLMEHLAKLQESWFDEREKTRAIIDFQEYIAGTASIPDSEKAQYYGYLDGFLFSDEQTEDEIALATSVIRNLVPKDNPRYDTITQNLSEILSHPTDTPTNRELGREILEIVRADESISVEDKLIIRDQVEVIVYGGLENIPDDIADGQQETESGGIIASIISVAKWIAFGFLGIVGFFVLLFLVLFTVFQFSNKKKNLGFQDYVIELFTSTEVPGAKVEKPKEKPKDEKKSETPRVDPLAIAASDESATTSETPPAETLSAEPETPDTTTTETKTSEDTQDTAIPSWLRGATDETGSPDANTPESTDTLSAPPQSESGDADAAIPSWLRESATSTPETPTPGDTPAIPDWLRQEGQSDTVAPDISSETPKTEETQTPTEESESALNTDATTEQSDEAIPDWLKDTDNKALSLDSEKQEQETDWGDMPIITDENTPPSGESGIDGSEA